MCRSSKPDIIQTVDLRTLSARGTPLPRGRPFSTASSSSRRGFYGASAMAGIYAYGVTVGSQRNRRGSRSRGTGLAVFGGSQSSWTSPTPGVRTCCDSIFSRRMSRPSPAFARHPASPTTSSHGPRRRTASSPFALHIALPWTSASVHWRPQRAWHRMVIAPSGRSYAGALLPQRYESLHGGWFPTRSLLGQINSLDTSNSLMCVPFVVWNERMVSTLCARAPWRKSCGVLWRVTGPYPRWRTSCTPAQNGCSHFWSRYLILHV